MPVRTSRSLMLALSVAAAAADVMNQGGGGVYAADGASLVRQANGLQVKMTVPTPTPGGYVYAPGFEDVGPPEVFTLWAFVFNYPNLCSDGVCGIDDVGNTPARGGVYNVGGHVAAGRSLTIAGRVGVGEAALGGAALESPGTAEVHVALAPHGALGSAQLPTEFRTPAGSPVCGCWWVAIFF